MIQKVLAYVVRNGSGDREVLVFRHLDHPDAGIQIPGGTIDPGESPLDALHREVKEESGLASLRVVAKVAQSPFHATWRNEWQERHVFHVEAPETCPDEWVHVVSSGEEDKGLRFAFVWMPLAKAQEELQWGQGEWLGQLVR